MASCTSVRYFEDINPAFDPAGYRRFAFLPIPHPEFEKQAYRILGQHDFSQVIVRSVLESKGYQFVEDETADFLVEIQAAAGSPELPYSSNAQATDGFIFGFERISGSIGDPFPDFPIPSSAVSDPNEASRGDHLERIMRTEPAGYFVVVEAFDAKTRSRIWIGWARAHTEWAYRSDEARAEVIAKVASAFGN